MMSHKKHSSKWLPLLLIALVAVLIRKIVGLITPQVALDDGQIVIDTNSPKEGVVQAPGEKIVPEPQPPQVPIATVAEVQSIPEVPSDSIGMIATIQGRPTGTWSIDAVSASPLTGQITFVTGSIVTEGAGVVGGTFVWSLDNGGDTPCIFTIASYTEGHLVGRLERGKISRKIDIPMHISFSERMVVMNATRALPYTSWEVLQKADGQSEFITFSWTVTLGK